MKIGDKVKIKDKAFEENAVFNGKEVEIIDYDPITNSFIVKCDEGKLKVTPTVLSTSIDKEYQPKHANGDVLTGRFIAKQTETVEHPSHYNNGGMECWDEMELIFGTEATMWFCLLSAWKYRYRMNDKDTPEKNMRKSHECIKKYKELKEKL